jgi:NAD-dependent deacetylase
MIAAYRANEEANVCNTLLIIGTSGVVYPAAEIPFTAKSNGATIIEINIEDTPYTSAITDHFLKGSASEILPKILEHIE